VARKQVGVVVWVATVLVMTTSQVKRPPSWVSVPLTMVTGVASAAFGVRVLGKAMADCDVGINASANSFGLIYVVLPVLAVVDGVVFAAVFRFGYGGAARLIDAQRPGGAVLAGGLAFVSAVAALALVLWAVLALGLGDVADHLCPGDAPPWWPDWLPL
jgi:hypothetical protein